MVEVVVEDGVNRCGLFTAGATAWGAVHAVQPEQGETVVISGAAGGVGSLAVQLARRTGATVIGLASQSNHEWLTSHGVIPVAYGDGVADRIRAAAPGGVHAFIDTYGDGYVELALAPPSRPGGSTPSPISRPPRSTG